MYNIRRIEMAVNRVPVLKRCRSLGMDPIYLGINKKSNRQLKRANRKMSEYGLQLREKQKANSSTVFLKNLSETTMQRQNSRKE
mgnify:CR=1 FL=1